MQLVLAQPTGDVALRFQSSTRQTDFATLAGTAGWAVRQMFQSSTRQTDFATDSGDPYHRSFYPVSILYEADRLCNRVFAGSDAGHLKCFNPLRGRQTLQRATVSRPGDLDYVSILYEADRLCNLTRLEGRLDVVLVSILYEADRLCNVHGGHAVGVSVDVSILYEADRLCNPKRLGKDVKAWTRVSILYEADRLCNTPSPTMRGAASKSFNPLRGRQTLQPPYS